MNNETGFTLIEVLVSLVIFSFMILSLVYMHIIAIGSNYSSRTFTEAITWAESTMERLIDLDYDDGDLDPSFVFEEEHGIYTVSWDVSTDAVINDTKRVDINVRWPINNIEKSISLQCIKSR
ncbi:MAG: type IV pilus modification PilV family protein [bacterium]